MRILLFCLVSASCALATVPVRDGCGDDAAVIATIQQSDLIQVQHGVVGESVTCYAVSLERGGSTLRGYISDGTLPAVVEFERKRALESRVPAPEPPPAPPGAKKLAAPRPTGPPFAPWSGADINGKRLRIGDGTATITLVTFWSVTSAKGRRAAQDTASTGDEFRAKGLRAFGLVQPVDPGRLGQYMEDMGLNCPVLYDRDGLAAKYGADPNKGTTLVIDSSNHIVASSSNPVEIRAMVAKLVSSE